MKQSSGDEITVTNSKISSRTLRSFNEIHRSYLAQVRNVSDEVLIDIFKLARGDGIQIGQARDAIVELQQVCRRWRNLIRGTPSLWSSIQLTIINKKWATGAKMRARVQFCVRLSGNCPLSVTLLPYFPMRKFYPTLKPRYVKLIDNIIHEISRYSSRWAYLLLDCNLLLSRAYFVPADSYLRTLPKQKLPGLKTVKMSSSDTNGAFDALQNAISIENVIMHRCIIGNLWAFPWKNVPVKRLTIKDCIGSRPFHDMLPFMSLLEELVMEDNDMGGPCGKEPSIDTVTLPLLHTLAVSRLESRIICQFLLTPRLVNLRISEGHRDEYGDPSNSYIFDMIENSGCIIKRLQISCYDAQYVAAALARLRHVEELSVECFARANAPQLFPILVWSSGQLLPMMKHLEIKLNLESWVSSRFNDKQLLEISGHLREKYFDYLTNIMRSRCPTVDGEVLLPAPSRLSVFKTTVTGIRPEVFSDYESGANTLKKLGRSLGVMVAVDLHLYKEEKSSREMITELGVSDLNSSDEIAASDDEY